VRQRPRFGYRRVTAVLNRDKHEPPVNEKRGHRLWPQEDLQVPQKQVKKRRIGSGDGGCLWHKPERKDHVWCCDFLSDQREDGRTLKFLPIEEPVHAGMSGAGSGSAFSLP